MIPVVELLRVSTERQASESAAGIPAQRTVNRGTASRYGLEVVESVQVVVSGAEIVGSTAMNQVLDAITSKRARGILLAEYSRLFRPDRWSDLMILQTISDCGAQIYLPTGPIDLSSELGFVQATINNLLAGMERRRIRERMDRGKEEHRRAGRHVAGAQGIPFGMSWSKTDGWAWTPDSVRVRELFRRFISGNRNLSQLGRDLDLPRTNVRFILMNPVYTGIRVYDQRHNQIKGVWKRVPRRPEDVIRVKLPIEPLVSEEDFEIVQHLLRQKKVSNPHNSRIDRFLYRGMLQCTCGLPCYTSVNNKGRAFYYCRSHNRHRRPAGVTPCGTGHQLAGKLEAILDRAVSKVMLNPAILVAAVAAHIDAVQAGWRGEDVDREGLQARLAQLVEKRDRIVESYLDGVISRAERDQRLAKVADESATIQQLLDRENPGELDCATIELIERLVSVFAEWSFLEREGKREILEAMTPTFRVRKYAVEGVYFPGEGDFGSYDSASSAKTSDSVGTNRYSRTAGGIYVPLVA